ncbi:hypothetical protein KC19_2G279600 [Ceratodon purpureus]|uniref:Uncharacterized protein n=1 Tax=Ceratodon purpureus TaxID=3225 RepID=A0A8T0J2L3_CERPU|nr:hypothetical protein KC19_2G279600 [Ceratodon purpureus]
MMGSAFSELTYAMAVGRSSPSCRIRFGFHRAHLSTCKATEHGAAERCIPVQ